MPDSLHTYCVTGIAKQRESIKDNIIDIKPPILLIPPFFSPINPYTIIILTNNILISIFLLSFLLNVKKQTKINSDSCLHKFTFYFVVTSYFNFIITDFLWKSRNFQDILYLYIFSMSCLGELSS